MKNYKIYIVKTVEDGKVNEYQYETFDQATETAEVLLKSTLGELDSIIIYGYKNEKIIKIMAIKEKLK